MVKMSDENVEPSPDNEMAANTVDSVFTGSTETDVIAAGGDSDSGSSLSLSASPAPPGTTAVLPEYWNSIEQSDADSGVANGSMPIDCFDSSASGDGAADSILLMADVLPDSLPPNETKIHDTMASVPNSETSVDASKGSPNVQPALSVHNNCNGISTIGGSGDTNSTTTATATTASGTTTSGSQQYVVNVHVNAGETFSVRVGDRVQLIHGPATVRMVSNSGPPVPMPMQVPPGHMVQQIVDENGILTHVILSPQPPGIPAPPTMIPNCSPMYQPYGYAAYPQPFAPHHHPGLPTRHIHPMMGHMHHTATAGSIPPQSHHHQCNSHVHHSQHVHPTATVPPPSHHVNHAPSPAPAAHVAPVQPADERAMRTRTRLRNKLKWRNPNDVVSQRKGTSVQRLSTAGSNHDTSTLVESKSGNSSFDDTQEAEDDIVLHDLLSKIDSAKVSEIEARSALIQLTAPTASASQAEVVDIDSSELIYELSLSEKRDGVFTVMYSGDATEITLRDLKPASEYYVRVCCLLDNVRGDHAEAVSFTTLASEPEPPAPPKLVSKTKTTLQLKWNQAVDNGSKITAYSLEHDQGKGDSQFVEVYCGAQKQFKVVKLAPSTSYTFRVAALNSFGKSRFSDPVVLCTSGTVPPQTDPPMLSECCVKALTISWVRRPCDDTFTLQMDDEATGHGFLPVYNGSELSHKISQLRRNTEYKFRLQAANEEGCGKWSDVVSFRTLPDRPQPPPKPQIKGRLVSNSFRVFWDEPKDTGGVNLQDYQLQLDAGNGYQMVHRASGREFLAEQLEPGHTYRVRVCCYSTGGQSDWSDVLVVTTLPIPPGQCKPPRLHGRPKSTFLTIVWEEPDYDGGSQVSEYSVQMNSSSIVYRGLDLQCSVASLLPGRSYSFQVRAHNKAGPGLWSDCLDVMTAAGVPDVASPPEVVCKSPHVVLVSWNEPACNGSPVIEYHLEWQIKDDQDFIPLYTGPATMFELAKLSPATNYGFRVQAVNAAGPGSFSAVSWCRTHVSSPGAVASIRVSSTETTIQVSWKEPACNGSKILQYNIDIGDSRQLISVDGNTVEHVVTGLTPETTYKVRVQAVNSVGVGAFGIPVKVTTRALPPLPPSLECVLTGSNSLKLKWGDGKNPDLIRYCLEMKRETGSFQQVYYGSSHMHKVSKLNESTDYFFRIFANNEAGDGPLSTTYCYRTTKALPPAMKAPKITDLTSTSATVEWLPVKSLGTDNILYVLQLQRITARDSDYHEIYRGSNRSFRLDGLTSKYDYQVRVGAMRQLADVTLSGLMSPATLFTTLGTATKTPTELSQQQSALVTTKHGSPVGQGGRLSEQQLSVLFLLAFAVIAVVVAFIAKQIID